MLDLRFLSYGAAMPIAQPNILLIVLDTLRRDRLSGYGHGRETSPELDWFAADSTRFERAVSPAQWTIPSHASMFTGVYASTHQVTEATSQLSGAHPTLAEILHGTGYDTVGFCNNPLVGVLDNGLTRGFEHFYNYAGTVPNRPFDTGENRFRRTFKNRFRRFARPIENYFAQSDTLFRLSMHPRVVPFWSHLINFKGHTPNTIDDVIAYWGRHQAGGADRPLFAFVNLMGTHLPYNPPQDFAERVAPGLRRDKQAYAFMRRFNSDAARWASPPDPVLKDWEQAALYDFYDAEIVHQDYHLGRLLRYLKASGGLDDTLVIICSDHGEGHGDHDFVGHGFVVYQELVHVPLIIHAPEHFPAGKQVATNVSTRRIFHTILDAAGVKPPLDEADPNANVAALTLRWAVEQTQDTENGVAFAEAFPPHTFLNFIEHRNPALIQRLQLNHVRRSVYDGSLKLTTVGEQVEGLFDVANDPAETLSIAHEQTAQAIELQQKLAGFVQQAEQYRADSVVFEDTNPTVIESLRDLGYIE
jgi:uncharacterized sulfatase